MTQSNTGQDGASEAIFDWHVDKQNDLTNAFLTVIINLRDTTTSMQIAGCKEYYYDGIGSAAVFYSRLWHKTGIEPPGTMKVALFCGNNPLERFPKKLVHNTYPDCLCINTHNLFHFAHIHRNSIKITDIDEATLSELKQVIDSINSSKTIRNTQIDMMEWEENKLPSYRKTIDGTIVKLLSNVNRDKFVPRYASDKITTRQSNPDFNIYQTKYHFLKTLEAYAQDPHIDYKWTSIEECKDKIVKPKIALVSLSEDGLMINVWFQHCHGQHVIDNKGKNEKTLFLPYKLQVDQGKIAFLNGDVIHGGGLLPSGS